MRYLFFDIECCDGTHICEFGYVLADERLNVIKKENILMNPEKPFHFGYRRPGREIQLTHKEEEYLRAPNFKTYYETIKRLLEEEEQRIIGFSTSNDAKFLNTACGRYGLPAIEFKFYDVQKIYKILFNQTRSLDNAAKDLGIPVTDKLHESSEDSYLTMEIVKEICKRKDISVEELCQLAYSANFGNDLNKQLSYLGEHPEAFSKGQLKRIVGEFAKRAKRQGDVITSEFTDKKICFSSIYEKEATRDCVVLIQQIVDRGGSVCFKVSECDYYIMHEEDDENDKGSRYHHAKQVMQDGSIKILSFGEFLSILGLDEAKLKELPIPQVKTKGREQHIEAEHATYCLGDILRKQNMN